jgi:hypothetical protein
MGESSDVDLSWDEGDLTPQKIKVSTHAANMFHIISSCELAGIALPLSVLGQYFQQLACNPLTFTLS